jgi:hypothetical protein
MCGMRSSVNIADNLYNVSNGWFTCLAYTIATLFVRAVPPVAVLLHPWLQDKTDVSHSKARSTLVF